MSLSEKHPERIIVICVGNKLMLDEGIGPAVYEELVRAYDFPDHVTLCDKGCMTMDMISYVDAYDYFITVDAVDDTESEPGTVFRYKPCDMRKREGYMQSLHDLKLTDLFDAAALLGYEADGICYGMQVENREPAALTIGLTPKVHAALPHLVEAVLAELVRSGVAITVKATGESVGPGYSHTLQTEG